MDWLAGSRIHFAEILLTRTGVLVPLILLGFSPQAMNAYVILVGVQAVLAHANVQSTAGGSNYVLVSCPRYHHWHHAQHKDYVTGLRDPTCLVDMLFGTFKLPRKEWPTRYGVFGKDLPKASCASTCTRCKSQAQGLIALCPLPMLR